MYEGPATSYDEVPYDRMLCSPSHPDVLATVATLYGLKPPPVRSCRALELGCASGGNLIPMAFYLPNARFVGIDFSPRQVAEGQNIIRQLDLSNIDLKVLSILDVTPDLGEFDYIICHGVYSWVPREVQDKILAVCAQNLAADGLALVSYNAYPGWAMRLAIRDMLCFHVRPYADPATRVEQARAFMEFLDASLTQPYSTFDRFVKHEAAAIRSVSDSYFFHDLLEEHNHPLYFSEFAERAARHKLQYVAEAWPGPQAAKLSTHVKHQLEQECPERIRREQYFDFLSNREFRVTLLCHDHQSVPAAPRAEVVTGLYLSARVLPVKEQPDIYGAATEHFRGPGGGIFATDNPVLKTALVTLVKSRQRAMHFADLANQVFAQLAQATELAPAYRTPNTQMLAQALLECYLSLLVELNLTVPSVVVDIGERPSANRLTRLEATTKGSIPNPWHQTVDLGDFDRALLQYLDGSRDRAALLDILGELVANHTLTIQKEGQSVTDAVTARELLAKMLEASLQKLAKNYLLES